MGGDALPRAATHDRQVVRHQSEITFGNRSKTWLQPLARQLKRLAARSREWQRFFAQSSPLNPNPTRLDLFHSN
jgi:hypothetical protein